MLPALCLWLGSILRPPHHVIEGTLFLTIILVAVTTLIPGPRWVLVRCLLPFLLGLSFATQPTTTATLPTGPVELQGVISTAPRLAWKRGGGPQRQRSTSLLLRRLQKDGTPIAGKLWIRLPGPLVAGPLVAGRGDRVQLMIRSGSGSTRQVVSMNHWQVIERGGLLSRVDRWRLTLIDRLLEVDAVWGCALLLGERRLLPSHLRDTMRNTGLNHLLAVSGLHIGLVLGCFLWLACRFPPPTCQWIRTIGGATVLLQAFLSGADPPALRAALTGVLVAIGFLDGKLPSVIHALLLCIILWCAMGIGPPQASATISLCAVLGIHLVTGANKLDQVDLQRSRIRAGLGAFFGAHVAIAWWSPDLAPLSPLWTLCMLPLLALAIVTALLTLFVSTRFPMFLKGVWHHLSSALESIPELADRLPWTPWTAPAIGAPALSLSMLALLWLCAGRRRHFWITLILALFATGIDANLADRTTLRILPLGRGQGVLIDHPTTTLLYDAGSLDIADGGAALIRRELWKSRRSRIDWIIISHPHLDHYAAVPELLQTGRAGGLMVADNFTSSSAGRTLLAMAHRHRIPVRFLHAGERFRCGPWQIRVLAAPRVTANAPPPTTNNRSLVLELIGPHRSMVLAGDAEASLLASCPLAGPIDQLLLPHHGSHSSGLAHWLANLSPDQVLVSRRGPLPLATVAALDQSRIPLARERDPLPEPVPMPKMAMTSILSCRWREDRSRWMQENRKR